MKQLALLILILAVACSPIDDYITRNEFSENMRSIEKYNGNEYAPEDFETLRNAMQLAERTRQDLQMEELTYRRALDNIRNQRLQYEADMQAYRENRRAIHAATKDVKSEAIKVWEGKKDGEPNLFAKVQVANNGTDTISQVSYDFQVTYAGEVKGFIRTSFSDILPGQSETKTTSKNTRWFDDFYSYDLLRYGSYQLVLESVQIEGQETLEQMPEPQPPFNF